MYVHTYSLAALNNEVTITTLFALLFALLCSKGRSCLQLVAVMRKTVMLDFELECPPLYFTPTKGIQRKTVAMYIC